MYLVSGQINAWTKKSMITMASYTCDCRHRWRTQKIFKWAPKFTKDIAKSHKSRLFCCSLVSSYMVTINQGLIVGDGLMQNRSTRTPSVYRFVTRPEFVTKTINAYSSGARKHAWRTQAAWAKIIYPNLPIYGFSPKCPNFSKMMSGFLDFLELCSYLCYFQSLLA